ncbi:MAG: hypothetical protein JWR19_1825 [Pedosphaera sp.]|nr:hypothetical protein [Pedosphaera sp.]
MRFLCMSIELVLARFDSDDLQRDNAALIMHLADVARAVLRGFEYEEGAVTVSSGGNGLQINLPGGTAQVYGDHAQFPIDELDALTIRVIFEIAKAGNLVAITEGGKYFAILTDVTQRSRLPVEWRHTERTPVSQSVEEFNFLLQDWYVAHKQYAERAFDKIQDVGAGFATRSIVSDQQKVSGIVYLHRLEQPNHQKVELAEIFEKLVQIAGEQKGTKAGGFTVEKNHEAIEVRLPAGSATIYANEAVFYIVDVDLITAKVIFEIARIGNMAIVTCKPGGCQAILTDPDQVKQIPAGWNGQKDAVVVCRSSEELAPLLKHRLELDLPPNVRTPWPAEATWVPGTRPTTPREVIYVEAKPKETTAARHQSKLYSFNREHARKNPNRCSEPEPRRGILMSEFWRLETPEGKSFYAYAYGGEKKMWRTMIREFATADGRMIGRIENFEIFLQDDGRSFPVSVCRCNKVKE